MRNTLQEQYNLLKEGKMNKQHFFKSARHLFPDLITPTNSFTDAVTILKNRGIISEGIGGLVTTGKKQDWHAIFNENMGSMNYDSWKKELIDIIKKDANLDDNEIAIDEEEIKRYYKEGKSPNEVYNNIWLKDAGNFRSLNESKEAKAIEKETTKEVTDMATRGYDYKDEKNYDNVFGQEFLKGYYTEMKDPKNADKDVEELRAIVAKNLAKDISYYVKNGQFGVKGLGYTTEAPGLGEPKEAKGKYKSSGYGDLKESVLRLAIQDIIKEVLVEEGFKTGDYVKYDGKACRVKAYHKMSDKYDLEDPEGEILKNIPANKVSKTAVKEALDKEAIKEEGERAKKEAIKKRITNEMVMRKKKMKALQTLTELDEEVNEENAKKLKELQSEIKQLEGMMGKLDKKKKEKNKEVEETLYDDPTSPTDKPIVATSPQSKAALTKAGMKEIPGTKDAK